MNEDPASDPVEEAIAAFGHMEVPARPDDALMLAQLSNVARGGLDPAPEPVRSPWRVRRYLVAASIAGAVVLAGGVAFRLRDHGASQSSKSESVARGPQPTVITPPPDGGGTSIAAAQQLRQLPATRPPAAASMTPARAVANAEVIVVGKALDAGAAPPKVPGDLPEYLIRYQVERVLKGKQADKTIVIRTPTSPEEFLGKEWILALSPEFMAGRNAYAWTFRATAETEAQVKDLIENLEK
jgi:hypothetical protein